MEPTNREPEEAELRRKRAGAIIALIMVAFAVLAGRLFVLQIVRGEQYAAMSEGQTFRPVPVPAPRGDIVDRNGIILATTHGIPSVSLVYTKRRPSPETVALLSRIIDVPRETIESAIDQQRSGKGLPFWPVRLKVGLSEREQTLLWEYREQMPGVEVDDIQPVREYPALPGFPELPGPPGPNFLGYVLQGDYKTISEKGGADLEQALDGPGNSLLDATGTAQLGPTMVDETSVTMATGAIDSSKLGLAGVDGEQLVQVDAAGRPLGQPLLSRAPTPGNRAVLTVDARVQAVAQQALANMMTALNAERSRSCPNGCHSTKAAATLIDVHTGGILTLASMPTFDPNVFSTLTHAQPGSPAYDQAAALLADWSNEKGAPFTDHARITATAPGSTFKPVTALAALSHDVVTARETVYDPGYFKLPGRSKPLYEMFAPHGHGSISLQRAIQVSCDVYFWTVGTRLKSDQLLETANLVGLGGPVRVEAGPFGALTVNPGVVASPESERKYHPKDLPFTTGDLANAVIGQGDNQFTTVSMAQMAATIATRGTRFVPYIVQALQLPDHTPAWEAKPQPILDAKTIPTRYYDTVRSGMLAGATQPSGTSYDTFHDFAQRSGQLLGRAIQVAGKTGTAETGGGVPDAWYIAFAPYDKPEVAVAVWVENGSSGAHAAAPVARAILEAYFGMDAASAAARAQAGQADVQNGSGPTTAR